MVRYGSMSLNHIFAPMYADLSKNVTQYDMKTKSVLQSNISTATGHTVLLTIKSVTVICCNQ